MALPAGSPTISPVVLPIILGIRPRAVQPPATQYDQTAERGGAEGVAPDRDRIRCRIQYNLPVRDVNGAQHFAGTLLAETNPNLRLRVDLQLHWSNGASRPPPGGSGSKQSHPSRGENYCAHFWDRRRRQRAR